MQETITNLLNYKELQVKENKEQEGIEVYFTSYPGKEVINTLKENCFKWSNFKKCWYIKQDQLGNKKEITEGSETAAKELENIIELTDEEKREVAKELWNDEKMQDYLLKSYDFYKTKDGLILELEKVNKISIEKTMYYDDETEAPEVTENNFILYNRYNVPGRNLEEYLKEKERLQTQGCATGQYDYKGIYFTAHYYKHENVVACGWAHDKDERYFKRYLTAEEEKDFIELMNTRKEQYIERLKKYWKRYGDHVSTHGYWANR